MSNFSSLYNFLSFEVINSGSQGILLKANDSNGKNYAIKVLNSSNKFSSEKEFKKHKKEYDIMEILGDINGIPKVYYFGKNKELNKNVIIEEFLEYDLRFLKNQCVKFSLKTSLKIFYKLVFMLKKIHEKNIIHRDLKPENLMISNKKTDIFLIDFGLAKIINKNKKVIKTEEKYFTGNLRYCGLNSHNYINNSKVDDLFAAGFIFIDFFYGSLPWNNIKNFNIFEERNKFIQEKKINFIENEIKKESIHLYYYFKHLYKIKNDSKINYLLLLEIIENFALDNHIDIIEKGWDWDSLKLNLDDYRRLNCKHDKEFDYYTLKDTQSEEFISIKSPKKIFFINEEENLNVDDLSDEMLLSCKLKELFLYNNDKKFLQNK